MKVVLASIVAILLVSSLSAQTTSTNPQGSAVTDEVVVTASGIAETVQTTPASVTVITRDEIDRHAARDVSEVLRDVPGLTVSRTGSEGRATSLFTRGANSTHTLVLWNGIEMNNPYFSGYDWGRFSTVAVEQVEVVRGPFSSLYGSEAMAGVVNVITAPQKSGFRVDVESGQHGLRNAQIGGSYVSGGSALSLSYEHREDAGFNTNDDFTQNAADLFWRYAVTPRFSIGFAARRDSYDLGIPFNNDVTGTVLVPSPNRRGSGSERQLAVPIQQTIGRFAYDLTLSETKRDDVFRDPDDPFGLVDSDTASKTRRARLATRTGTPIGTLVIGAEYVHDVVDDTNNFGPNLANNGRSSRSIFVEDRYAHDFAGGGASLQLAIGARYDHFDTFGSQTSPRLGAAFLTGAHKLHVAFGQAFRAPSVGELYFPFSGNRELNPEHSRSWEVGYDYALSRSALFSATYFNNHFRDLIVFDNASFVFGNIGRASTHGVELGLEQKLGSAYYTQLSYTFLHTQQDQTGDELLRRPKHSGSLFVGYRSGSLDTNVAIRQTGGRFDVLPVSPYSRTEVASYTTIDANVQLHLGRLVPYFKVENLRDKQYEEVLGYRSPGRRTIFGIRYSQ
jgi:vitamin B12 transporter